MTNASVKEALDEIKILSQHANPTASPDKSLFQLYFFLESFLFFYVQIMSPVEGTNMTHLNSSVRDDNRV